MERLKRVIASKLIRNGFWMLILQCFNTIVPLLTLPYITRILDKTAYGEFSIALNWIGYFQVIVEYGFGFLGARKAAMRKSNKDLCDIHTSIIFSRMLLMMICLALFFLISIISKVDRTQFVCMLILYLMILSIVFQQTWLFQGISEMSNITISNVIGRTLSVILIFLLVKSADDLYLYCLLYVSNYIVTSVIGCVIAYKKYHIRIHRIKIKMIFKELQEGWSLFISSAMSKLFSNIGVTILGIIATKDIVGVYSAINKIPLVLTLFYSAVSQTLYPQMCKYFSESFEVGVRKVKRYGSLVLIFFVVGGFILIIFNKTIVRIAFGSSYVDYSSLIIPFVIWLLFSILNNFLGIQTLVASGHQKEYSFSFTISVVIMLMLMVVFGKKWNAYGIAVASMCSEIVLSLMLIISIRNIRKMLIKDNVS